MRMHPDQLHIDADIVRALVEAQFPQWRGRAVEEVRTSATVNAIFRLGSDLVARFPLVDQDPEEARAWLAAEADAAVEFAEVATVSAPRPVALGEPGAGYRLPWSVQTWLPGSDADVEDPGHSEDFARDLAGLIAGLRRVDTRGRHFGGAGRGGHLTDHDEWMQTCFANSERLLDVPLMRTIWAELRGLPEVDADAMCHGDLTPFNVLVHDGRLVGVLDAGGYGAADPALDLVSAWHLLEEGPREVLRATLDCGDVQWRRGIAWAFAQAMGAGWYYVESNPAMSRWARRTLDRIARSFTGSWLAGEAPQAGS